MQESKNSKKDIMAKELRKILEGSAFGYAILQLSRDEKNNELRFSDYKRAEKHGFSLEDYEIVWHEPLAGIPETENDILDALFVKFNTQIPGGFRGHSLSVSDIIVLKRKDSLEAYYVDSYGFQLLHESFLEDPESSEGEENCEILSNIRDLCYELYKIDWMQRISARAQMEECIRCYQENQVDEFFSLSEWIFEQGYGGSLYVCYDEFLHAEYLDKEYIFYLIGDAEDVKEAYLADLESIKEPILEGLKTPLEACVKETKVEW